MRIILDLHTLPGDYIPASNIFITETMIEMARRNTNHTFIFLAFTPPAIVNHLPANATIHYINKNFSKWFGRKTWYQYILPKELARLKTDLFVTVDNVFLKKISVPVCLFLVHLNALLQGDIPAKSSSSQIKLLTRAISNATMVITFSENDRKLIQTKSPELADKVRLLRLQTPDNAELKWTEKETVKIEFAGGVEYFAFAGDLNEHFDLIGLLKAFSLFKKWQQSNMQLLIVGNKTSWAGQFSKKLASYKYRNDVKLLTDLPKETVQRIIDAAYAFVYPAMDDHFPVNILQAMQAGIPAIATSIPVIREWGGNGVMFPETNDAAGFAKSMQLIYKDEKLRSEFIDAAKKQLLTRGKNDMIKACRILFDKCVAK